MRVKGEIVLWATGIIAIVVLVISTVRWIRWGLSDAYSYDSRVSGFSWEREYIVEEYHYIECTPTPVPTSTPSRSSRSQTAYASDLVSDCGQWNVRDRYRTNGDSKEVFWPKEPQIGYREKLKSYETYWLNLTYNDQTVPYVTDYDHWRYTGIGDRVKIFYNNFGHVSRLEFSR